MNCVNRIIRERFYLWRLSPNPQDEPKYGLNRQKSPKFEQTRRNLQSQRDQTSQTWGFGVFRALERIYFLRNMIPGSSAVIDSIRTFALKSEKRLPGSTTNLEGIRGIHASLLHRFDRSRMAQCGLRYAKERKNKNGQNWTLGPCCMRPKIIILTKE